MKYGAPNIEVIAPTGISVGGTIHLARLSDITINIAPPIHEKCNTTL